MIFSPLYRSFRESFSKDIYLPMCGIVAAPTVVWEVKKQGDLEALTCSTPPQNVILPLSSELAVCGTPLYDVLKKSSRSVPILCFDSADTVDSLARFTEENHVADLILCTSFTDRALLRYAYERMPLARCMLDCRGQQIEIGTLPGIAVSHGATSVILDPEAATGENVHALQQRFIHVVTADQSGFDTAASRGVNGIITENLPDAYAFLEKFPEGSLLRRRNLIAHKGFQNDGMYTENTITSVVAAAEHHFDGAEIDVKLTWDDIPVVMHNQTTQGLFDCPEAVTEKSSYAFLSSLRRIGFPDESIDRFDDLMYRMKQFPDTPVLIEIKPAQALHNVEQATALIRDILRDPRSQTNCIGIMGSLDPGLRYVHSRIPELPLAHCEGGTEVPDPPANRDEAEERLYRIAKVTAGSAGGYNPEDVRVNRLLNEYAKFRMMHIFVWSRSWTMEPSKWEKNGPLNDHTYRSGFDAWTTDHGEKYLDYPISVTPLLPDGGRPVTTPRCRLLFRDGCTKDADCGLFITEAAPDGKARVMYSYTVDLHFGDSYTIFSEPVWVRLS